MTSTLIFIKISLVIKDLFDRKTGEELERIKAHFSDAYSDAQLCALVAVALICRVFGLTPPEQKGSRSVHTVISLFVHFLKTVREQPDQVSRAIPSPLDIMVEDGITELEGIHIEA